VPELIDIVNLIEERLSSKGIMKHKCLINPHEVLNAMGVDSMEVVAQNNHQVDCSLARYRADVFCRGPLAEYIDVSSAGRQAAAIYI
jgi:hypothetical protein